MHRGTALRTPLLVNGIYGIIAGLLLFFPSLGAAVFAYQVKDVATVSGWGVSVVTIGLLAAAAASDVEKYGGLAWLFAFGLLFNATDLSYFWIVGLYTARNVLMPIIIDVGLAAWIWYAQPKR